MTKKGISTKELENKTCVAKTKPASRGREKERTDHLLCEGWLKENEGES